MIDPEDIAYEDRVSGDASSYTGNGSGEDDGNNEDWAQAWEDYNSRPLNRVTIVTNK
jgi:hypothetical protein